MNSQSRSASACRNRLLHVALAVVIVLAVASSVGTAKSLFVIAEIVSYDRPAPVQAYDIGVDGRLTFQAEYGIPFRGAGVIGLAVDSDSESLFVTYENSNRIQVLNAATMTDVRVSTAPGAQDLAGIVYDHDRGLLYCVDRGTENLYAYRWDPVIGTLTNVVGSPFQLKGAQAYGIALDEIDDHLYVANASK